MNTSVTHLEPQSGTIYFCSGCNSLFRSVKQQLLCPDCGMNVADASSFNLVNTQIAKNGWRDHSSISERSDDANSLVGSQIHIYQLESHLGSGGMGHVYLAHHQHLERKCALKILAPSELNSNEGYINDFQREGRSAASLVHASVVTTHAIGEEDGYHYLEMEYVAGRTLRQLICDEGRLAPLRATAIAQRIAEGLSCAHNAGILHRDLKLGNVLMTIQGIPKIADFGLAKNVMGVGTDSSAQLAGTPHFMAPELFDRHSATPASDVYALGVCYFLMLTAHHPFAGNSLIELISAIQKNQVPSIREALPEVPLEMTDLLFRMLDKTPGNRPQNGHEVASFLHAIAGDVRDIESLLQESFRSNSNVSWQRRDDRYELHLFLPEQRKQRVYIEASEHAVAERLLLIYSICCDATPKFYEEALRINDVVSHGALSIKNVDGVAKFCMVDTYPRSTVNAEEIRRSVLEVAAQADAVEKLLTNRDVN